MASPNSGCVRMRNELQLWRQDGRKSIIFLLKKCIAIWPHLHKSIHMYVCTTKEVYEKTVFKISTLVVSSTAFQWTFSFFHDSSVNGCKCFTKNIHDLKNQKWSDTIFTLHGTPQKGGKCFLGHRKYFLCCFYSVPSP